MAAVQDSVGAARAKSDCAIPDPAEGLDASDGAVAPDGPWEWTRASLIGARGRLEQDPATGTGESWTELPPLMRWVHTAIYNPVEDCFIAFGGAGQRVYNSVWENRVETGQGWAQLTPRGTTPPPLMRHLSVYDPRRQRMIVLGGFDGVNFHNEIWQLSLRGVPTWSRLEPSGTPPGNLSGCTATYDPRRNSIIVICWQDDPSGRLASISELSLDEPAHWTERFSATLAPLARTLHSAVYDPTRGVIILFGGLWFRCRQCVGQPRNDVWELQVGDSARWRELETEGLEKPIPRYRHSAVFDAAKQRMLVFGGAFPAPACGRLNDTWELSLARGAVWKRLSSGENPPVARQAAASAYDSKRNRWLIHGGLGDGFYSDLWAYDLGNDQGWVPIPREGVPTPRRAATLTLVPETGRAYLVGGLGTGCSTVEVADNWELKLRPGAVWEPLRAVDPAPAPRYNHATIYDERNGRLVLYGGAIHDTAVGDLWALDVRGRSGWVPMAVEGVRPPPRGYHTSTVDPRRNEMIVIGGSADIGRLQKNLSDVWALSLGDEPRWRRLVVINDPFRFRGIASHCAVYDNGRDEIVLIGGKMDIDAFNWEVWALSRVGADTVVWKDLGVASIGIESAADVAFYDAAEDRIILYGYNRSWYQGSGDVWELRLGDQPSWRQLEAAGRPVDDRKQHAAVFEPHSRCMFTFGGYGLAGAMGDLWALDLGGKPGKGHKWAYGESVGEPSLSEPGKSSDAPSCGGEAALRFTVDGPVPSAGPLRVNLVVPADRAGLPMSIGVFDVSGRLVEKLARGPAVKGIHAYVWNPTTAVGAKSGPGVYFIALQLSGERITRRTVVLR